MAGTAGVPAETVTSMTNVVQLDQVDATHSISLSKSATGIDLQVVILP